MKPKKLLNKITISNLNAGEMAAVKGASIFFSGCQTCLTEAPECKSDVGETVCYDVCPAKI